MLYSTNIIIKVHSPSTDKDKRIGDVNLLAKMLECIMFSKEEHSLYQSKNI